MATSDHGIVAVDRFIRATRDSGYRSTTSAVAELVDNSLQAGARKVDVLIRQSADSTHPIEVLVIDDGGGMTAQVLRQALRFGGSSRFDDRSGLGRFGMGLPNASLSQSRRVDVWSASEGKHPIHSYLDVDEIAEGELIEVPKPVRGRPPVDRLLGPSVSGTVVAWTQCDRLDNKRVSTLETKISGLLGRMYRHFLWDGVTITVNDQHVESFDPLYMNKHAVISGATLFEKPREIEVRCPDGKSTSIIKVAFTELPVDAWNGRDNAEKRRMGISNGAGVSFVRGNREVDYGWILLGGKRRENYDDWWRCEILFDPELDELFGITHTKQQVRPSEALREILEPLMVQAAKVLNGRVREKHTRLRNSATAAPTEEKTTSRFAELKPLPKASLNESKTDLGASFVKKHKLTESAMNGKPAPVVYRVIEDKMNDKTFFSPHFSNGHAISVINQRHVFYKKFYRELHANDTISTDKVIKMLHHLFMAATRAEGMAARASDRQVISAFRSEWGASLAAAYDGEK